MRRGEIWWANLSEPIGRRPVLLISRSEAYILRANVIVVPLTKVIRGYAVEIVVTRQDGVPKKSVINTDTILTISKKLLTKRITTLSTSKLRLVDRAIAFSLSLESAKA